MKYTTVHEIEDVDPRMAKLAQLLDETIIISAKYHEKNGGYRLTFNLDGCESNSSDWISDLRANGTLETSAQVENCAEANLLSQYDGDYYHDSLGVDTPEDANDMMIAYMKWQLNLYQNTKFEVENVDL